MWIMIAGPYRHGSEDPEKWKQNLIKLNQVAYEVLKLGHTPIIGVNMALPIIENTLSSYEKIMMPMSLEMAERCDAVLRIGGASAGADMEVEVFRTKNLPIYYSVDEIPK
ncbi:MAG: DUF4406 domain-containing protein [Flavobacteriales bacterium]|nr:DUF4406 domain-containing protein [Flavobacteriales bacterium]